MQRRPVESVMAQKTEESEITEKDSLLLTRNLLRIAIYSISYIRGLFHEKYFSDKSVPALEMKIKKLMPMDAESRRLIDWMEKGVYDALQKKYLKALLFCICEEEGPMIEEYAFSFSYPNTSTEEFAMNMSRTGSKKGSATFTLNASEVTPDQMRSSACKMIRTLVSLMRTLDLMPEERTILMKLLYYDDVTPEDYEPPFFKGCADNEAINIWNKNPLKMEMGNVNSRHLVLALKVKSALDPCDDNNVNSGDDGMSVDNETDQDDDFSDTEVYQPEADRYVVAPSYGKCKSQSTGTISEDDTQDAAHEEELTAQVREWICSREIGTINASDVLSNFPDISMEMVEDIMERLLKDGVLSRASKDGYTVNQTVDPKTPHIKVIMQNVSPTEATKQNNDDLIYMKALYHALPMDYVTIAKLEGKLDGEASQNTVRKLIDKMVQDGSIKNSANRLGKAVIHSESSNKKLLEIKKILEGNEGEKMAIDTNAEHVEHKCKDILKDSEIRGGSTMGCLQIGSDLTLTRELPAMQQNVSMQIGQEASAMNKLKICSGHLCCISSREIAFLLDSGAPYHICRDRCCLHNFKTLSENQFVELCSAEGEIFTAKHKGNIIYHNIKLNEVLFSRKIGFNVISVAKLDLDGLMIYVGNGRFTIHNLKESTLIGEGYLNNETNDYEFRTLDWCSIKKYEVIASESDDDSDDDMRDKNDEIWVIDTCCSKHMVGKDLLLSDAIPEGREFRTASGAIRTTKRGNVSNDGFFLSDVSFCPDVKHNLMSVAQLDTMGYSFTFCDGCCVIQIRESLEAKGKGSLNLRTLRYNISKFIEAQAPTQSKKRKRVRSKTKKRKRDKR